MTKEDLQEKVKQYNDGIDNRGLECIKSLINHIQVAAMCGDMKYIEEFDHSSPIRKLKEKYGSDHVLKMIQDEYSELNVYPYYDWCGMAPPLAIGFVISWKPPEPKVEPKPVKKSFWKWW